MARILAISSQVARGHVGLSIIVPALEALGHDVIALPTVFLSNHPGHAHCAGTAIDPDILHDMLDALKANGWLTGLDAILTGYLPTVEHVAFARRAVEMIRTANPTQHVTYLCDPVLGDDPKGLYIDERAAIAIRSELIPVAGYTTPNRFELSFVSGHDIRCAKAGSRSIPPRIHNQDGLVIVATSIPSASAAETSNVLISGDTATCTRVPLRRDVPHGTGDLFSALLLAALTENKSHIEALALATSGVDQTLAASTGRDELLISALPTRAHQSTPWPVELCDLETNR